MSGHCVARTGVNCPARAIGRYCLISRFFGMARASELLARFPPPADTADSFTACMQTLPPSMKLYIIAHRLSLSSKKWHRPLARWFTLLDYLPDRDLPRLVGERQEKRRSETAATIRRLTGGQERPPPPFAHLQETRTQSRGRPCAGPTSSLAVENASLTNFSESVC